MNHCRLSFNIRWVHQLEERDMYMRALRIIIVAAFTLFTNQSAYAGSMNCGVHRIQDGGRVGPGMYEVLKKCGEPTFRQGNSWVYEKSGNRYILVFKDSGVLSSISRVGR